jgi:hypothetical protein
MRKTRTWISNAHNTGREYSCKMVVGLDRSKQYVTSSHTFGNWYSHFMCGARLRMGMIWKQNKALTLKLALAVCTTAEARWSEATEEGTREELEDIVCFMLITFAAGLRGEEIPLLSMEGLLTFWEESRAEEDHHIMFTLKGRFKGEIDERWHLVPVSDFTKSGLPL